MFNKEILNDIVCPIGSKELKFEDNYLLCTFCNVRFPILENIPVLLIDKAILPEGVNSLNELKCVKK
jgi:uncharacterized protein YbaR (Trm112 family)